jgi:phosphotransferase system enzyme I (PtsI)
MSAPRGERRGVPVSPGIAIGPAYVLRRERIVVPEHRIRDEQADGEVARMRAAFAGTRSKLEEIRRGMQGTGLVGTIFDAQFLFREDPTLEPGPRRGARNKDLK